LARTCATPSTCATPNDSNRSGPLIFSNSTSAGSGIGSSLEGQIAQFQRFDVYSTAAANRQKRGGLYAQDSWRVTPRLTLKYGVRWDIIFPETVNTPGAGASPTSTQGASASLVLAARCFCGVVVMFWRGERGD
jgi:outer membrane receptor protein involved in Fe transport